MNVPSIKRTPLVIAAVLVLASVAPIVAAVDLLATVNEYERDVASCPAGDGCSTGYVGDSKRLVSEGPTVIPDGVAWAYFSVKICLCGDSAMSVTANVEGPSGATYGPWVVDQRDTDHLCCGEPTEIREELIILVDPSPGEYLIVLTPGPSHDDLPPFAPGSDEPNIGMHGSGAYRTMWNASPLGDNTWWFYPDGSKMFVEDGPYIPDKEGVNRSLLYLAVAVALLATVGWLAMRERRRYLEASGVPVEK